MGVTNFDTLGRLTLPAEAMAQLGLCENSGLLITVLTAQKCLVLRPTHQATPPLNCAEDINRLRAIREQPVEKWRYVRALDNRRRVVLPQSMREWLGWSDETRLQITLNNGAFYVQEAAQGRALADSV